MRCSFCEKEIESGKGTMYIKANGTLFYFCSSKCKKNTLTLKRKGKDHKWTTAYKEFIQKQEKKSKSKKAKN